MSVPHHAAFYVLVLASILLAGAFIWQWPDGQFHYIQCDVGQGDAILLSQGFTQVLIDGGKGQAVLECLRKHLPFWDRNLEWVVATHADLDHIEGLPAVLDQCTVKHFGWNGLSDPSPVWIDLESHLKNNRVPISLLTQGTRLHVGNVSIITLWPLQNKTSASIDLSRSRDQQEQTNTASANEQNNNEMSLVLLVQYKGFKALLTGDLPSVLEEQLPFPTPSTVTALKAGHHGSKASTGPGLLSRLQPRIATIGVGHNNRYHHPSPELLERLKTAQVQIRRTDLDGDIEITSDGVRWRVNH